MGSGGGLNLAVIFGGVYNSGPQAGAFLSQAVNAAQVKNSLIGARLAY